MTNTERKPDEARFFIEKLDTSDPYFDYFLSAFLNAARSTTWIMRNEFHNVKGWEQWFESFNKSNNNRTIFQKINELRILSTKQTGIKTDYLFLDTFLIDEDDYPKLDRLINDEGVYKITVSSISDRPNNLDQDDNSFDCKINRDIVSSRDEIYRYCQDYFNQLSLLVTNCINKFQCI